MLPRRALPPASLQPWWPAGACPLPPFARAREWATRALTPTRAALAAGAQSLPLSGGGSGRGSPTPEVGERPLNLARRAPSPLGGEGWGEGKHPQPAPPLPPGHIPSPLRGRVREGVTNAGSGRTPPEPAQLAPSPLGGEGRGEGKTPTASTAIATRSTSPPPLRGRVREGVTDAGNGRRAPRHPRATRLPLPSGERVGVRGEPPQSNSRLTRRFCLPLFSILPNTTRPISPVRATWVPPQGCRST